MTLTVITGPPCAGKTSYVAARRQPGDLVIDFDALAGALGSDAGHGHDPWLARVAAAAWSQAVRAALAAHPGHRAWVIDARPSASRIAAYRRAGATVTALRADAAELHRRASADGRPGSCHEAIDQWRERA